MQFIEALLNLFDLPVPGRGDDRLSRAERVGCAVGLVFAAIGAIIVLAHLAVQYLWSH